MGSDRDNLPFRETSDCFLIYQGKIVAKDMGYYVAFPGGGVDEGESPLEAANREIIEETGAVTSNLVHLGSIKWIWHPEWANTPKRKDRYSKYQGELVNFIYGNVLSFGKPTSDEGDAWEGNILLDINDVIELSIKNANRDPPNMFNYREAQLITLKLLNATLHSGGSTTSRGSIKTSQYDIINRPLINSLHSSKMSLSQSKSKGSRRSSSSSKSKGSRRSSSHSSKGGRRSSRSKR